MKMQNNSDPSQLFAELHYLLIEPWNWCCLLGRNASYLGGNHKVRQKGGLLLPFGSRFEEDFVRHFMESFREVSIKKSYVTI